MKYISNELVYIHIEVDVSHLPSICPFKRKASPSDTWNEDANQLLRSDMTIFSSLILLQEIVFIHTLMMPALSSLTRVNRLVL